MEKVNSTPFPGMEEAVEDLNKRWDSIQEQIKNRSPLCIHCLLIMSIVYKHVSIVYEHVSILHKHMSIVHKHVSIVYEHVSIVHKHMSIVHKYVFIFVCLQ